MPADKLFELLTVSYLSGPRFLPGVVPVSTGLQQVSSPVRLYACSAWII